MSNFFYCSQVDYPITKYLLKMNFPGFRWENVENGITDLLKKQERARIEWHSFTESVHQAQAWLDSMDRSLPRDIGNPWISADLKARLVKAKAFLQELQSHQRLIDVTVEKGRYLSQEPLDSSLIQLAVEEFPKRFNFLQDKIKVRVLS